MNSSRCRLKAAWAGGGHSPAQYEDLCLDLGGGKNPEPAESLFFNGG
ncbi:MULTISPECIES: hypothetical protein [Neisseria]|nr:hypothetical protein [Neisseria polysaccharea]